MLFSFFLGSCDSFLEKEPNKSSNIVPETIEQLEALINNYSTFAEEPNIKIYTGSDSWGLIPEIAKDESSTYLVSVAESATWGVKYLPFNMTWNIYYTKEYSKIFIANLVLYYLDRVDGSEENKRQLSMEAKFIRAYSLWNLAQTYCLPYNASNESEMGVCLKDKTTFEDNIKRSSLKQTYDFIENDLKDALGIENKLEKTGDKYRTWRASKAAVNAFAARFYLNIGNYESALKYSNIALDEHNELVDYNSDMRYSTIPSEITVNNVKYEIKYPYTHDNQSDITDRLQWKEMMYYRTILNDSWWYIPSQELLNKYNHDYDLRYKYHIVNNYSYDRGLTKFEYPGYIFFFKDVIISGPTTAEMLLIKAESLARTDKVEEAMTTVNQLREVRMDKNTPKEIKYLSASTKEEAVMKIIDERWREMPFTQRWFDLRRLNHNEESWDDLGNITRHFYEYNAGAIDVNSPIKTYTLEPGSRYYAAPFSQSEIEASKGNIIQNEY